MAGELEMLRHQVKQLAEQVRDLQRQMVKIPVRPAGGGGGRLVIHQADTYTELPEDVTSPALGYTTTEDCLWLRTANSWKPVGIVTVASANALTALDLDAPAMAYRSDQKTTWLLMYYASTSTWYWQCQDRLQALVEATQ